MNCDADAMNVGYSYTPNDDRRNFIYRQLHKYSYTITFPSANFLCLIAICQFIIPGKRICYCGIVAECHAHLISLFQAGHFSGAA